MYPCVLYPLCIHVYPCPCVLLCTPCVPLRTPCAPMCTPVCPCVPPCTHVYPCAHLLTPVYPCVPLCTPVYPGVPLCTPMYPYVRTPFKRNPPLIPPPYLSSGVLPRVTRTFDVYPPLKDGFLRHRSSCMALRAERARSGGVRARGETRDGRGRCATKT